LPLAIPGAQRLAVARYSLEQSISIISQRFLEWLNVDTGSTIDPPDSC